MEEFSTASQTCICHYFGQLYNARPIVGSLERRVYDTIDTFDIQRDLNTWGINPLLLFLVSGLFAIFFQAAFVLLFLFIKRLKHSKI